MFVYGGWAVHCWYIVQWTWILSPNILRYTFLIYEFRVELWQHQRRLWTSMTSINIWACLVSCVWLNQEVRPWVCPLPTWPPGVIPGGNGLQCPGSPLTGRSRSGGSVLCSFQSHQSPGCPPSTGTHLNWYNRRQAGFTIEDKSAKESIINKRNPS